MDLADFKVTNILWTSDGMANQPTELPCMLPDSSLQPELRKIKHCIVLEDAHMLQNANDELASLLEGEFNSIIPKSPIDMGRTNLFQMDIPTAGPPVAGKPCPILVKYQKVVNKEIKFLENVRCISKKFVRGLEQLS